MWGSEFGHQSLGWPCTSLRGVPRYPTEDWICRRPSLCHRLSLTGLNVIDHQRTRNTCLNVSSKSWFFNEFIIIHKARSKEFTYKTLLTNTSWESDRKWKTNMTHSEELSVMSHTTSRLNGHTDQFHSGGTISKWAGFTEQSEVLQTHLRRQPSSQST